jgi:formylglycine-generating enzyme required for sulfatase activity
MDEFVWSGVFSDGRTVNLDFVYIPYSSSFRVPAHLSNSKKLKVVPMMGFWVQRTPFCQGDFNTVCGYNPSEFKSDKCPVENLTLQEINSLIFKLNSVSKSQDCMSVIHFQCYPEIVGEGTFSLPSELHWDYVSTYGSLRNSPVYQWWSGDNSNGSPQDVGLLPPCGSGVYDLAGNVWELVTPSNTLPDGYNGVLRGGSWRTDPRGFNLSNRIMVDHGFKSNDAGFRLIIV